MNSRQFEAPHATAGEKRALLTAALSEYEPATQI
jgi:hypothetical protein